MEAAASHDLGKVGEDLQRALDAARRAEESRDAASAELVATRAELASARASSEQLERERGALRAQHERIREEARVAAEARDDGVRLVAETRAEAEELRARLAETEEVLARARREAASELSELTRRLGRTDAEYHETRSLHAEAVAERDRLAAELADASAARARAEETLAAALVDVAARERALAEACARSTELAASLTERDADLRAARETAAAENAALAARLESLRADADGLRNVQAALAAERDRLAADLEGTVAAKAHLEQSFQHALEESRERERALLAERDAAAATLAERDGAVQALEQRLVDEAAAHDLRARALVAEADALREALAALNAERDRLAADLEGAAAGQTMLEQALAAAVDDARGLVGELQETRGRTWDLALRLDQAESTLALRTDEHAAQVARLTARLDTFLAAADQLREAHANVAAECDRLSADLEGATAAKVHLEEALQAALDDARTREHAAAEDLAAARAQHWTTTARLVETEQRLVHLGEERASETTAHAAKVEGLEADADRLRESTAALAAERDRLAAALEGTAAAKAHLEDALKHALETARAREQEAAALVQETRGQAWTTALRLAETEVTVRALADEHAAEVAALSARTEALASDTERLREAASAAETERDHLAAELAGTRGAHERLEQSLAEARAREQALAAGVAELEQALATRTAELEGEVAAAKAELAAAATARVADAPRSTVPPRSAAQPSLKSAAPPPVRQSGPSQPMLRSDAPTSRLVAVLDDESAWRVVPANAAELAIVSPSEEAVTRLAGAAPGRVLANLAAPGALKALLGLRDRGASAQIYGYIAGAQGDRVLPLGRVEPAARPLAPDAIVAALAVLAPARARVVTVGADVDALLSLRQALARQGTSVSLAWDAKQAIDLLDMINPHAVVADLGAPQDASAVLTRLAASTPVPIVVLIEGANDVATALTTMLSHPEVAAKLVSREQLLAGLGRVSGGSAKSAVPAAAPRPLGMRR